MNLKSVVARCRNNGIYTRLTALNTDSVVKARIIDAARCASILLFLAALVLFAEGSRRGFVAWLCGLILSVAATWWEESGGKKSA